MPARVLRREEFPGGGAACSSVIPCVQRTAGGGSGGAGCGGAGDHRGAVPEGRGDRGRDGVGGVGGGEVGSGWRGGGSAGWVGTGRGCARIGDGYGGER